MVAIRKFKRKTIAKKGTTLKRVAKQVKHLVALERSAIAIENDLSALTNFATAGLVQAMFLTVGTSLKGEPQELASNTSIKCNYLDVDFRYSVFNGGILNNSTGYTTIVSPVVRVIVFQDWANKQALPAVTDVLLSASVNSPYKYVNKARFQIKYDRLHTINIDNGSVTAPGYITQGQSHHTKIRFAKNRMIEYVGENGDVGDNQKGQVYVLWIADRINAGAMLTGSIAQHTWNADLRYETA